MFTQKQSDLKSYVIDIGPFLKKWHLKEFPASLWPKLDLQGAAALGSSIQPLPGAPDIFMEIVQGISPEVFSILDTNQIHDFYLQLQQAISLQLTITGIDFGLTPPLFQSWVGDTSLCLVAPNVQNKYSSVRTSSLEAAKDYIRRTASLLDGTEYTHF